MIDTALNVEKIENGTVATPKGFTAGGAHTGLRKTRKDMGVIVSDVPAVSTAVYTRSHFQAAPLQVTRESLEDGMLQAVVVNSAVANACTGARGVANAFQMRRWLAERHGLPESSVAVSSTGVIGKQLPMDIIKKGCFEVDPDSEGGEDFASSILTTDKKTKSVCYRVKIGESVVTVAGTSKGSGMIHPNMATMLGFLTTDAAVDPEDFDRLLKSTVNHSFNQITVDGETSTNDMVLAMANGAANNEILHEGHEDWELFAGVFSEVCCDLAKKIAADGEGATKLVEVTVNGAASIGEAREVAKKIVGSSLVKTAIYGEDGNWGRIIGAMGHSRASFDSEKCTVAVGSCTVFENGEGVDFSEEEVASYLSRDEVKITVDLSAGDASGTAWGCDLTYDYVKINASYRT
ncbi:bifunctional glutamate N-acetyltransferase/amino-acid acetyltransferase ArgJ [Salimicrobium salexigens]|uniref:Arginine biosynthesis bifunctional protein ArgJ n=1 Tax=Salimicrobium salexigens TaxID=908941 RepID=A0ABY1KNP3_9BACI|nr:bifunctional glutamate N-acetyltransferase/amino-acid acetyltransferase ArgJ [Salimicrobium salexigens]SIS44452.1 glutamate N-acetyltransferase [Salimicrobium salexigens]